MRNSVHAREQRPHKRRLFLTPPPPPVGAVKRCACGSCKFCKENARWERIFNEKFADAKYYAERLPGVGSTLANL